MGNRSARPCGLGLTLAGFPTDELLCSAAATTGLRAQVTYEPLASP